MTTHTDDLNEVGETSPSGSVPSAQTGEVVGHTPGEWIARPMHTGGCEVFDPRGRDVVTVYGGGVETESRAANARLIAAAPDLLEALQRLAADYTWSTAHHHNGGYAESHPIIAARAAISRATGGSR